MKKAILFGFIGALFLGACARNFSCRCTDVSGNADETLYEIAAFKKQAAKDECATREGESSGVTYTCELD